MYFLIHHGAHFSLKAEKKQTTQFLAHETVNKLPQDYKWFTLATHRGWYQTPMEAKLKSTIIIRKRMDFPTTSLKQIFGGTKGIIRETKIRGWSLQEQRKMHVYHVKTASQSDCSQCSFISSNFTPKRFRLVYYVPLAAYSKIHIHDIRWCIYMPWYDLIFCQC